MAKKLIAISKGNLKRVAASKGVETILALNEKTGVDRKTLRAIEAGRPVKETTLQSIADKLRVPIAHLVGSSAVESTGVPRFDSNKYRELKLQQLDAAVLRKLASEYNEINWILKIDQISEELEALFLKLRESLKAWFWHLQLLEDEGVDDNLTEQISHIKRSVHIDKCVEELQQSDLRVLGGTYVTWDSYRGLLNQQTKRILPILRYCSRNVIALAIVPKGSTNSAIRVLIGPEPPQEFREDQLANIDLVFVDGDLRWSRGTEFSPDDQQVIDNIPYLDASGFS